MNIRQRVVAALARAGYEIRRTEQSRIDGLRSEGIPAADLATLEAVRPFTMTSQERLLASCAAIRYVDRFHIPGAVVECGVWAGGSTMAMLRTLLDVGDTDRDAYLFDTFEGMSEPTAADIDRDGRDAATQLSATGKESGIWAYSSLGDVRANVAGVGYPAERLHLVQGKVEDTVPAAAPDRIAVLRLDTDWYESTKHELDHLIDRVSPGGVLIIDDYGHWQGARRAVDEWLATRQRPTFLSRIDYTGRLAVLH